MRNSICIFLFSFYQITSLFGMQEDHEMLKNKMNISTIIFDMNGVIIDDEPLHEAAIKEVCLLRGITFFSDEYKKLYMGVSDKTCFQIIIQKYNLVGAGIEELLTQKTIIYKQLLASNIKEVPGVVQAIETLSKTFDLALASSATREEIEMILKHFKIKSYFKEIVSTEDVSLCKPNPEPYLLVAEKLNVSPEFCLVIEDSISGVSSARAAGMKCIAITTNNNKQDLCDADFIIDNFSKIYRIVYQLKH